MAEHDIVERTHLVARKQGARRLSIYNNGGTSVPIRGDVRIADNQFSSVADLRGEGHIDANARNGKVHASGCGSSSESGGEGEAQKLGWRAPRHIDKGVEGVTTMKTPQTRVWK